MTTATEISRWFDEGKEKGSKFMLVICDTYDHTDYPVFVDSEFDCRMKYQNPGEMQRVMEIYDLVAGKQEQMNERRCFRLPN